MNAKQRKRVRDQKTLVQLGRHAKIVAQAAQLNEAEVLKLAQAKAQLEVELSQMTIDRNTWREEAIKSRADLDAIRAEIAGLSVRFRDLEAESRDAQRRVAQLKEHEAENIKLRRRLRERDAELAATRQEARLLAAKYAPTAQDVLAENALRTALGTDKK